jgi:hypothetical protein
VPGHLPESLVSLPDGHAGDCEIAVDVRFDRVHAGLDFLDETLACGLVQWVGRAVSAGQPFVVDGHGLLVSLLPRNAIVAQILEEGAVGGFDTAGGSELDDILAEGVEDRSKRVREQRGNLDGSVCLAVGGRGFAHRAHLVRCGCAVATSSVPEF